MVKSIRGATARIDQVCAVYLHPIHQPSVHQIEITIAKITQIGYVFLVLRNLICGALKGILFLFIESILHSAKALADF